MIEIRKTAAGLPFVAPPVFRTAAGTPYLQEAGVAMIGVTRTDLAGIAPFLEGFGEESGFAAYLDDPDELGDPERLVKFAGQLCYLSLGAARTPNALAGHYLENIKARSHGSVLEHATFSFLFWGVDRSCTHEIVRHRAGMSYSQLSQRYVDGKGLRFVERPEYQMARLQALLGQPPAEWPAGLWGVVHDSHERFVADIDRARREYDERAEALIFAREHGHPMLQGGSRTELRKMANQVAREGLPNSTEAPIVVSGNGRSWRHFIEERASPHADVPIRDLAVKVFRCLREVAPLLVADMAEVAGGETGTSAVASEYRKV